jgi:hypothetical protein
MQKKGLIKINTDANVKYRLKNGKLYFMHMPDSSRLLILLCCGIAINAADFEIMSVYENGVKDADSEEHMFGYQFAEFGSVHYSSFKYRERCELYSEEEVYEFTDLFAECGGAIRPPTPPNT